MNPAPLAPKIPLVPGPVSGVKMATCSTGIKYADRHDLLMMVFDNSASVAGVFTKSKCSSAPVDWCRAALSPGGALATGGALSTGGALAAGADPAARAVIVNAGNANAFTGQKGEAAVKQTAKEAAQICNCDVGEVYLASTGVIGEPLDAGQLTEHFADLSNNLTDDGWQEAAQAIMTTDTYPKMASQKFDVEGQTIVINGIAKGSGMIAPDMATMLSFVVTDMPVAQPLLQSLLSQLVEGTFNAITVDSDTSTSDSLMLFATGAVEVPRLESTSDPRFASFKEALRLVLHDLAMQTVRDGEGATKQVEICVTGAEDERAAKKIALSIANSPLVKTAVAGEDANWGRVVMAVGKAGEAADRDALTISFGDVRVAVAGERDPAYSEEEASAVMRRDEITISVDVGIGKGSARVWTCDLTKEYVSINGDYRS